MQFEICPFCRNYTSSCTCTTHAYHSEKNSYNFLLEKSSVELKHMKERIEEILFNRQVSEGE